MPKVVVEAAVAATKLPTLSIIAAALCAILIIPKGFSAVLPEERVDIMYHSYDGGGVTIDGPSLLVRKSFADTVSVSANYYVDSVSSASIDVVASGASEYSETRTEYSLTADYLRDRTLISGGYTSSDEDDYQAETLYFNINQDFFGDLTSLAIGYSLGDDEVSQSGNDEFSDHTDRQNFRIGLSQILTSSLIISVNYEAITEEGYLNNPYRVYRYLSNPGDPDKGFQTGTEVYPRTRTSDALVFTASYYLPYRAALKAEYRYYTDDWEIDANTYQISYTHPIGDNLILDAKFRHYDQSNAYFYNDLFTFESLDDKDFRGRDKELSQFTSQSIGLGVSYELPYFKGRWLDRNTLNLHWDYMKFDYDNFRDVTKEGLVGDEPLYSFDANVIRLFYSIWY